jgi:hypothetical protein
MVSKADSSAENSTIEPRTEFDDVIGLSGPIIIQNNRIDHI